MARCANCGRVNREGSVFCQDCGQRLPPPGQEDMPQTRVKSPSPMAPPPRAPTPAVGTPIGTPCPQCAVVNPPGMNFCRSCGTPLRTAAPAGIGNLPSPATVARPPVAPAFRTCTSCGNQTPGNFTFCQHCGARLGSAVATSPAALPDAVAATMAAPAPGSEEAFAPTAAPRSAQQAAALSPFASPFGAPPPAPPIAQQPAPMPMPMPVPMPTPVPQPAPMPRPSTGGLAFGRLVAVFRDGSDGQAFPLGGESVTIGRTDGELMFASDPYLAHRHAIIERRGAQIIIRPLDTVNGVYVRVKQPTPVADGDLILLGKEVLRLELVEPGERDPQPATQHGVLLFASPPRSPWGRLRQIILSGATRDVIHLVKPDVVLGREDGELRFPDDEFMSRRHAQLSYRDGRVTVSDLGSSNGTYLRLRREQELRSGDLLRMGDQLLRFEAHG
jgi:pSer/pThr/pTyr-binding forkhead associated (FHA) protein